MTTSPPPTRRRFLRGALRVAAGITATAGLTAAYELVERYGITSTVLESDGIVGGISRTVERDGWRFAADEMDGRRIRKVRVSLMPDAGPAIDNSED